jgi:ATP-dependent Lon protease
MRDYRDAKAMAQTLRQAMKERSVSLSHGESLELTARILGVADWNVLSALIQSAPAEAPRRVDAAPPLRRPVMPLRDLVLFPQMTTPIWAARLKSVAAIGQAMAADRQIFFVAQKQVAADDPAPADLHAVGVIASVVDHHPMPDGAVKLIVQGLRRARASAFAVEAGSLVADLVPIQDEAAVTDRATALKAEALRRFEAYAHVNLASPPQALLVLSHLREPGQVADALAQHVSLSLEERQDIL